MSIYPPLAETNAAWNHIPRPEYGHKDGEAVTALWMGGGVTIVELAREHIRLIEEDVRLGIMPWDVHDFSELHNYVDANEYTLEVQGCDMSDEGNLLANAVQDVVAYWLRGDQPSSLTWPLSKHDERKRNHRNRTVDVLAYFDSIAGDYEKFRARGWHNGDPVTTTQQEK